MEKIRFGIVGIGMMGRMHATSLQRNPHAEVVAVCARTESKVKAFQEEFGVPYGYTNVDELVNNPEVDAIVVATGADAHKAPCLAACKAKKHIFCEKPLADTVEKCKEAEAIIAAHPELTFMLGFMRRYDPGYNQLKKAIDSGKYGLPLMLHCVHRNYDAPGFTTSMPVENSMIHEIDVLRWLLGENYKTAEVVFPKTTRNAEGELRDPQIMYLTTESGVRIDVESFVNCRYGYDVRCEVVCEEGCINLPEPANAMIRTNDARVTPICHDWSERFPEAYNIEFQSWINACKEGRVDGPSAWDGYTAQVTAKAASKARDTQSVVEIKYDAMPDFYKK